MTETTPRLVDPAALAEQLDTPGLRIVDLSKPETYAQLHVPGAVHLDYARIVGARPPVMGLLPDPQALAAVLGELGIDADTEVVAYDDEGGGRAARLLWTLQAHAHTRCALVDGGLHAWANEGHPLSRDPVSVTPTQYAPGYAGAGVAERDYILEHLSDADLCLVDTRSAGEYQGSDRRAARGGHIPGAVHLEWTDLMDREHNLRLKPRAQIEAMLAERGVAPEKQVITYCQTHHRSAHTWFVLRHLGYARVLGYPGAWSDWGNQPDTPIEP
jgi:thiosulfate/3-mercaptopyruvate sulfurtransferase